MAVNKRWIKVCRCLWDRSDSEIFKHDKTCEIIKSEGVTEEDYQLSELLSGLRSLDDDWQMLDSRLTSPDGVGRPPLRPVRPLLTWCVDGKDGGDGVWCCDPCSSNHSLIIAPGFRCRNWTRGHCHRLRFICNRTINNATEQPELSEEEDGDRWFDVHLLLCVSLWKQRRGSAGKLCRWTTTCPVSWKTKWILTCFYLLLFI